MRRFDPGPRLQSFQQLTSKLVQGALCHCGDLLPFSIRLVCTGDRVLVEISRRISSAIRNSDVLVRWGGEEFLIVSRYTDRNQAGILAQRVMEAVKRTPFAISSLNEVRQTCSIGWAAFPWLEENVRAMGYQKVLKQADRGLYQAKRVRKDRAVGMVPSREGANPVSSDELEREPDASPIHAV